MKDFQGVSDYITRKQTVTNQLKRNEESLTETRIMQKILRSRKKVKNIFRSLIDVFEMWCE
jgi:hypothetical protein